MPHQRLIERTRGRYRRGMEIVILGAGVAGVAAAIVLAELGHDVRIYERRPRASQLGAGVTLWPNACFVLERLGLLDELRAVSGRPSTMQRLDWQGQPIATLDIALLDARLGAATHTVLRRDLQRMLLTRLAAVGVAVSYGWVAREVGQHGARAWVSFESGQRVESELLLGADGRVASVARHYVSPTLRATYQGFVNWVGIAESDSPLVGDAGTILDFWGAGTRFGIVPITDRLAYWAGGQAMSLSRAAVQVDPAAEVHSTFAAWPPLVRRLLAESPSHSIRKLAIHDLDPSPQWFRGHVLLIGDAAHASLPTSGQGACQALEDAWHLGRCLHAHSADLPGALAAFTQLRYQKTRGLTLSGRQLARSLFHGTPEEDRQRDADARAANSDGLAQAMANAWSAGLPLGSPKLPSQQHPQ